MASEKQYLDLYGETSALIDENSCPVLNAQRSKALSDFRRLGFPSRKVERYKYTDVEKAFAPNYGLNLKRLLFPVDPYKAFKCSVPNMGTALYYMVNDIFYRSQHTGTALPEGVFVGSLCERAKEHPQQVGRYYGQLAATADDGITALNTLLAQDGLLVHVAANVKVPQTVQVVNLVRGDIDLMTNRRVVVVVEDGAEVSLLLCDHSLDRRHFLTTQVVEAFMGKGSRLNLYSVEETHELNTLFSNLYVKQEEGSRLEYGSITLGNGLTRHSANFCLAGEGSEARVFGGVVADREQHVDHNLLIDHCAERCRSEVLYKYVLDGHSTGAFAGRVLVRQGAQHTDSQETNANLCVSPEARMFTQPMLEIYADDVKCNHGSTVGQLNESALFYMAQRGIAPDEARLLLQHAFVDEVIRQIQVVPLRERLSMMVEQRFRHHLNACGDCRLCN